MTASPFEDASISVTIKGDEPGGKFNDPKSPATWIVFHGTVPQVRQQIVEVFALSEDYKTKALYEVVNEATKIFKAVHSVSSQLGGTILSTGPATSPAETPAEGGDPWAGVQQQTAPPAQAQAEPAKDEIMAALDACTTVAEVQQVWAENQSAFNENPAYMDAYKARGKALSS